MAITTPDHFSMDPHCRRPLEPEICPARNIRALIDEWIVPLLVDSFIQEKIGNSQNKNSACLEAKIR
jgi:hypothetical protein